ncbi:acyl-CoA dehydrogenase family protein [Paenibacillus roseipurpureus]|uniref:Acyl-CoA dehydrogenase family protein n=1 Tax=Paenibacillus roseopurpureus TaxID=2918901 RepID=A0AA96LT29_9BACL|nr:acyl-CoA dehydrogenase family protein [Paenibacillus sp. MBLB1832]WNR46769.1 acyl-CoA dehydrogenase family protein [Paenibacillus sp. MBLB1832]
MDFSYEDEWDMIRTMVRDFAQHEVAPSAAKRDEQARFDQRLYILMAELGLTGIPWKESDGGLGADRITLSLVLEELAKSCASTAHSLYVHSALACAPIAEFGTEEQKQIYLQPLAQGKLLGAAAEMETLNGLGQLHALREEDTYIINGIKNMLTNAGDADIWVIYAWTEPSLKGRGCSAFVIKKDQFGVRLGEKENTLGTRSSSMRQVHFEQCRVPASQRLGEEGDGLRIAAATLHNARSSLAAQAIGVAQAAMEAALAYASMRKQFGKPIASQQAIAFKLANMATQIEAARLLMYQTACQEHPTPQVDYVPVCHFAGTTAVNVAIEALQIFGGYGYTKDFPVERYLRDAKMLQLIETMQEELRITISHYLQT